MTRLAVFSDIHGNLPALESTLAAIDALEPDAIWYAGDFVGYGPWPDECVQTIARRQIPSVRGNYDDKTLLFPRKKIKWAKTKDPRKFRAFEHAWENLSDESRAYLEKLPLVQRAVFDGHPVEMIHIAPDSDSEGIHPLTTPERLQAIARKTEAHVLLTGHTHWVFKGKAEQTLFVNCGSAGRPADGDPRAAFALVTLEADLPPRAEIHRIAYSTETVIAALEPAKLPADFADLYRTGLPLS